MRMWRVICHSQRCQPLDTKNQTDNPKKSDFPHKNRIFTKSSETIAKYHNFFHLAYVSSAPWFELLLLAIGTLVANVPGVTGDRACGKIGSAARGVPLSGTIGYLVANVPRVTGDRACGKIGSAARGVPLSGATVAKLPGVTATACASLSLGWATQNSHL